MFIFEFGIAVHTGSQKHAIAGDDPRSFFDAQRRCARSHIGMSALEIGHGRFGGRPLLIQTAFFELGRLNVLKDHYAGPSLPLKSSDCMLQKSV